MHDLTPPQRQALAEARLASDHTSDAVAVQRHQLARAKELGVPARPAGAGLPSALGMRRHFDAQQRAVMRDLKQAQDALSRSRRRQREAFRRATAVGVPVEIVAIDARVSLAEVRRLTERVPVT